MKRGYIHQYFILLIVFFTACTNNNETVKDKEQETEEQDPLADIDSPLAADDRMRNALVPWTTFLDSIHPPVLDSFRLKNVWIEDSLITDTFTVSRDYLDAYGDFIKYNTDSSLFIDLDSYNIILRREKEGYISGYEGGPDVQVFLVDKKNKKRTRLLFLGPGSSIDDAYWIDKETVLLVGVSSESEEMSEDSYIPCIWKVNVEEGLFEKYNYTGIQLQGVVTDYSKKVRLRAIDIR